MNKKQAKPLAVLFSVSLILFSLFGASSVAADGNNDSSTDSSIADREESHTAGDMTAESLQSMLEDNLDELTLLLEDGSKADAEYADGEWMSQEVSGVDEVDGIEIEAAGESYTFHLSEVDPDIGIEIFNWLNEYVTFDSAIDEVGLEVPERAGEIEEAELVLKDGSTIELDLGPLTILDESYEPEQFSELRLVVDGTETVTPLSDSSNYKILLGVMIIYPELEGAEEVAGVKLEISEEIMVDAAKLIMTDLSPLELEKAEEGVFMAGDEEVSSYDLMFLILMIDGEEHTITLGNRDFEIDEEGFLIISSIDEDLNGGTVSMETPEESGMLPDTGDKGDAMYYLAGLLIISFGIFNLRNRKLHKE
ncbi:MAG: LPXTG cell wall anchor domain-containing protein [Bacillota bacterium]